MLEAFYERVLLFMPNFFAAVILLIIGIVLARILRLVFLRTFRAINVDRFWDRAGMRDVLNRGGIKQPLSAELSIIVYWLTLLIFVVIALNMLHIPAVDVVFARFFLYLPNVFTAVVILLVGYLLSNFLARAALIALVNSGVMQAGIIARLVRASIFVFAVVMALEQLDIGRQSVLVAFAIVFGGVVLALAIAVGLGAQHFIKEYMDRQIKACEKKDEINHL
jgi:hypothetical protein